MSRPARIISKSEVYHIIFRGINRQNLFEEEKEFEKMLKKMNGYITEKQQYGI